MKRLALVLFVCLSVQMSALSAPFVHLHADAGHDTDHHEGRAIHRHLESHGENEGTTDHAGQSEPDAVHSGPAEQPSSPNAADEPAAPSIGVGTAAPATSFTTLAGPATAFADVSHRPAPPPPVPPGTRIPAAPDISPPLLRGPPR